MIKKRWRVALYKETNHEVEGSVESWCDVRSGGCRKMEERTGVERQGRQARRPTGQEARVGLGKGTETARSACEIVRGEARLKRQGNLMITASPDGCLTMRHLSCSAQAQVHEQEVRFVGEV